MLIKLKQALMGSAAGKVMDVAPGEAKTLIDRGIAEPAGDDALSPVIVKAAEALTAKLSDSIGSIVDATLARFQEAQEQARRNSVPAIFGDGSQGDPRHNFGDWLSH